MLVGCVGANSAWAFAASASAFVFARLPENTSRVLHSYRVLDSDCRRRDRHDRPSQRTTAHEDTNLTVLDVNGRQSSGRNAGSDGGSSTSTS
jgi:hypothetical protein